MCDRLRERSLVDKLFVSVCSNANHPISERDVKVDKKIIEKLDVDGNTQGKSTNVNSIFYFSILIIGVPLLLFFFLEMLQYISTNKKICLVVLDYAGLTTDPNDLKKFLE